MPNSGARPTTEPHRPLIEPLQRGILALAGARVDTGNAVRPGIDVASLAPPPQPADAVAGADFDPQAALLQTIALNRGGQHIEASRIANDALSRLPANAPAQPYLTVPLKTKLKIYELPDWQNITTDVQITAPPA